jgi:altronate dehydratase
LLETGGIRQTIEAGVQAVQALLADANNLKRQTLSASHLSVGLQCGGSKPAPCIKLDNKSPMFKKLEEDMDINCGGILDGTVSVQEQGQKISELYLRTASG